MSEYSIACGNKKLQFNVPDENLLYYATPNIKKDIPDFETILLKSLNSPIGTGTLESEIQAGDKVAIIVDDNTRPTPCKKILPYLNRILKKIGVPDENIVIAIALGTHKRMSNEEIEDHIGFDNIRGYKLLNLDFTDMSNFTYLGDTPNGTPIDVYTDVINCDYIIGIGNIVPHTAAGWGGGAKIVEPGICSARTTRATHVLSSAAEPAMEKVCNINAACRREIEAVAKKIGLNFIINTILDQNENTVGIVCGDFIEAHRAGVKMAEDVLLVKIPRMADIVITTATPADIDYWQALKPYVYAQFGVREGGIIIFVMDGRMGLCGASPNHEAMVRKYSLCEYDEIVSAIKSKAEKDLIGLGVPAAHATVRKRTKTFVISPHWTRDDAEALGFDKAESIDAALDKAYELVGKDASVGVITYGELVVRNIE